MNLDRFLRILGLLESDYDDDERIRAKIDRAREYVDSQTHRADVVAQLPQNAPAGMLLVTPGDINLYVGTGAASPLRKIPTQAL